jgi:hypothetical protein
LRDGRAGETVKNVSVKIAQSAGENRNDELPSAWDHPRIAGDASRHCGAYDAILRRWGRLRP